MKTTVICLILGAVFVSIFTVRIKTTTVLGPTSAAEVDDLQIQEAHLDVSAKLLTLVTRNRWTHLDLNAVLQTNRRFDLRGVDARDGNFVYWSAFARGRPPGDQSPNLEKVAVLTDEYASFSGSYCPYPPDGRARRTHQVLAPIPGGYRAALYRSDASYRIDPEPDLDDKREFKSYVLVLPDRQPDGRYGVQFFYHPDVLTSVTLQPPSALALLHPSFLALCIALPLAISRVGALGSTLLFALAFVLHGLMFVLFLGLRDIGESTGGYTSKHDNPYIYLVCGVVVLLALVCVRVVRRDRTGI